MFPAIYPGEMLLLDRGAEPAPGDVILFQNRFGLNIAHRLYHSTGGWYFTRGDNCAIFNFPCRRKDISGIIVGKSGAVESGVLLRSFLNLFLLYYIPYTLVKDTKKKRNFLLLDIISRCFVPVEGIYFKSSYDNGYLNTVLYGIQTAPPSHIGYYLRKAADNRIVTSFDILYRGRDEQTCRLWKDAREKTEKAYEDLTTGFKEKEIRYVPVRPIFFDTTTAVFTLMVDSISKTEIMLSLSGWDTSLHNPDMRGFSKQQGSLKIHLTIYLSLPLRYLPVKDGLLTYAPDHNEQLFLYGIHLFDQGYITLDDVRALRELIPRCSLSSLTMECKGEYELMGLPLIIVHLFDMTYNKGQDMLLSAFVQTNYPEQLPAVRQYLEEMNYEMPFQLLHFCRTTNQFPVYGFLSPPRGFDPQNPRYRSINSVILRWYKFKQYRMYRYMQKKRRS